MKLIYGILAIVPFVFGAVCVATTAAQVAGLSWAWSEGALSRDKLIRYAALAYGLDLSEVPRESPEGHEEPPEEMQDRRKILERRAAETPLLQHRVVAMEKEVAETAILFDTLQSDKARYEQQAQRFDAHLSELEQQTHTTAILEVQQTLEVLRPAQSKELLLGMLAQRGRDPDDDVMEDVVAIIKGMTPAKRGKILREFKTEQEGKLLHEILVEIGELEER